MMPLATHSFSVASNQMLSTFDHEKTRIANPAPAFKRPLKMLNTSTGAVGIHGDYGTKF
jgi:hypothetical protein